MSLSRQLLASAAVAVFAAAICSAQNIAPAHSGTVHYFEGDVTVDGVKLVSQVARFTEMKEQSELHTGLGRAEILLTPGVLLRVGENSTVKMLDNRLVSTRVMPEVFRASHVRRVANFFQAYRNALQRMVPVRRENPRIVVLTPGPYNETYFEHAFLARYLGYTLVEGGDLTVRENRVFLKTLGGLLPVDVIVRRQDDHFCDPLELRADSMLGVPGLVQAVRSGTVSVANALGSGLAESPAYAAFLPGLCKQLLGEVVEQAVSEGSQKAIADNALKPAIQPRIEPVGDINDVVDGKADLSFTVTDLFNGTPPDSTTFRAQGTQPFGTSLYDFVGRCYTLRE